MHKAQVKRASAPSKAIKAKAVAKKHQTKKISTKTRSPTTQIASTATTFAPLLQSKAPLPKPILKTPRRFFSGSYPSHEILTFSALSPTMERGKIASWEKKIGQKINVGDAVCQIVTDKATVSFDATDEGYLAKILIEAGDDDIEVGQPIAVVVEDEADVASFANFAIGGQAAPAATPTPAPAAPAAQASKTAPKPAQLPKPKSAAKLTMPALSPTQTEAKLVKWLKKEGDLIKPGDIIAEMQTDKAVVAFESQDEYYLAKILIPEGTEGVAINAMIGATAEEEGEINATRDWAQGAFSEETGASTPSAPEKFEPVASKEPASHAAPKAAAAAAAGKAGPYKHRSFGPAVHNLIHIHNIDPSYIKPTGGFGYLTKSDVLEAIESGNIVQAEVTPKVTKPADQTASKPTSAPKAATSTPNDGLTARRRRARTFTDIPVTPATTQKGQDIVASKQTPQHSQNGVVSLTQLTSFINTFATDSDINSAMVSIISRSLNNNLKGPRASTVENDLMVHDRATGGKYLLSRHHATQIGQNFKRSQAFASVDDNFAQFNIHLFTNVPATSLFGAEPVVKDGAVTVTVGVPHTLAASTATGVGVDTQVTVTVTANNNKVDELVTASIMKDIKSFAKDPIMMLL